MGRIIKGLFSLGVGGLLLLSGMVQAEEAAPADKVAVENVPKTAPPAKEEKKGSDKLGSGVIASYGSFSKQAAVNSMGESDVPGDKASPISGSVARKGNQCTVTVTNTAEEAYIVSYEVVGYRGAAKAFNRYFTARLAPKASAQRSMGNCEKDINVQVVMKSGRKVGK